MRSVGYIFSRISFKFCTDVHHSQIYTPIVFGDAAPSVPSFIMSKVIFWFTFLYTCALAAAFRDRFFFKFCMGVYFAKIYTSNVFGDAAPSVLSFIGLKVIFWFVSGVRYAGHIS